MSRRVQCGLAILALGGAVVAALPWWLGPALHPLGRAYGVTFRAYERVGYARFRLEGVEWRRRRVAVTAARVETETPLVYGWRLLRGGDPPVTVADWQVTVAAPAAGPAPAAGAAPIDGVPALFRLGRRMAAGLRRWLPRATLRNGAVEWPGGRVALAGVDWRNGRLAVSGLQTRGQAADATVRPAAVWTIALRSAAPERSWGAQLHWSGATVDGVIALGLQPLRLKARFAEHGWVPEEAEATADQWSIAAGLVGLGAEYSRIQASGRIDWRAEHLEVALQTKAAPAKGGSAPPWDGQLEAHASRTALTVTRLHLEAPFVSAELSEPVRITFGRNGSVTPARLSFSADLSQQPWVEARGRVRGDITTAGPATEPSRLDFHVTGADLLWHGQVVRSLAADGQLRWPQLRIDTLTLEHGSQDRLACHGSVDLQAKTLHDVVVQAHLSPGVLARWLPPGLEWAAMGVDAEVSGPIAAPEYRGTAAIKRAHWAPLQAMDLAVQWAGRGRTVEMMNVHATAGASTLQLDGTVDDRGATVRELRVTRNGSEAWSLAAPAHLQWTPALALAGFDLRGAGGGRLAAALTPGAEGTIKIVAAHVDPEAWRDWVVLPGPSWRIDQLQADGRVAAGRLAGAVRLTGLVRAQGQALAVRLAADSDGRKLHLTEMEVTDRDRPIVRASGNLPVWWEARPRPHWQMDPTAPLELTAATEPDAAFWEALAGRFGLKLTQPEAHLDIRGTIDQPRGTMHLAVSRLSDRRPGQAKWALPPVTDLAAQLQADGRVLKLESFAATIEGQRLSATGQLPLPLAGWLHSGRRPAAIDWRNASARVDVPGIDLAPFARRWPDLPLVQGRLQALVELAPGGRLTGEIRLTDGTSRPFGLTGIVQDINGDVALAGRRADVRSLTAAIGGEPVRVTGWAAWPAGGPPRLHLSLDGSNLPLVRTAGLLVRSDLALHAETDRAGLTHVTGAVTLRDCLVMQDLTALLPTGQRGITRQPPYFAVPVAPFDRWPLAVTVRGPQSVKIQTAVFAGTASPRFDLAGTLGEPRAVGELTVDQGQVFFPFATFNVQLGSLRLAEADPFRPQLNVEAVSERPDYELRLAVTGDPLAPDVALTSNPPLESSQLLLLVTTGQPPATGTSGAVSTQQRLAGIGAYLGKGLLGGLGGGGAGRLTVISGNQLSEQGKATYEVDYRLGERWTLVGEYDQFDDYNAGLKWRIYEKGGPHARP
jgi:translocation and assembly module TamB